MQISVKSDVDKALKSMSRLHKKMNKKMPNRRPCINTRTDNFHFSVSFDFETGNPVEFFITGRGKVGQDLDTELYELSVKASKLMQGE